MNYESQIRNYIVPNLGDVPLLLFVRDAPERLESFYARLRRCRELCSGRPFVEQHEASGAHDCTKAGCHFHECKPYAASSVRQIHAILSGSFEGGGTLGLDRLQPDAGREAAGEEAPAAAAADAAADGADRRGSVAGLE